MAPAPTVRELAKLDPMKGSRTWNRRDFSVTADGYFTVLTPAGWFPTVRLPGGFRYRFGNHKTITSSQSSEDSRGYSTAILPSPHAPKMIVLDHAANLQALSQLPSLPPTDTDRNLTRIALIALTAIVLNSSSFCRSIAPDSNPPRLEVSHFNITPNPGPRGPSQPYRLFPTAAVNAFHTFRFPV